MIVEPATSTLKPDALTAARNRVRIEPIPDWVQPVSCPDDFKPATSAPITHLLMDHQLHAERRQTFVHIAMRLETMAAVQHQSQWRLEFAPQTQSILLHSISIRRGDNVFEHADVNRLHFLQREGGLEGFVLDGWVTLLLLVDDVRPGDVLEWAYTVDQQPLLLPEHCTAWFAVPEGIELGRMSVIVRHAESRPLKWRASPTELKPEDVRSDGEVRLTWWRDGFSVPEPDEGAPSWHLGHPWIQISDCPDWGKVSRSLHEAWMASGESAEVDQQLAEITSSELDPLRRVDRAITMVQDEFRYLSVNLELGGHVPASPGAVLRRRYGDCKDLAFLLVQLLRKLDLPARPVLVNSILRSSLAGMLPSPGLFNHVVVEYVINGQIRWVDATLKQQGGGALGRVVPDFGLGLPVDQDSIELKPPPAASLDSGVFELKERLLVDTTGDWSHLEVIAVATGPYAESLRLELDSEGLENVAKKRLQHYTERYSEARRVGMLHYRDERDANRFVIAEVFEVRGFLLQDNSSTCWLEIQNEAAARHLPKPRDPVRRSPLALPHPCRIVHTIEVESLGLDATSLPSFKQQNEFFEFLATSRGVRKSLTATFSFATRTGAVTASRLTAYRKELEQAMTRSTFRVGLPAGYARMRKRDSFGALPPPLDHKSVPRFEPERPKIHPEESDRPTTPPRKSPAKAKRDAAGQPAQDSAHRPHSHRRRRHKRAHRNEEVSQWFWVLVVAGVLGLIVLAFALLVRM